MLLIFLVFRENTHASSVVEVAPGQIVVATGPYRFVRHPMYTGAIGMGAATPLALGSFRAAVLLLPVCAIFVARLLAEERLLARDLPGYRESMHTVRKRLVPGLW